MIPDYFSSVYLSFYFPLFSSWYMIYPLASDFLSASTNLPQSFASVSLNSPFNLQSSLRQHLHFALIVDDSKRICNILQRTILPQHKSSDMLSSTPIRSFMRSATKYLTSPHPHGRHPANLAPRRHYTPYYASRIGRTAMWYGPTTVVLLGWPLGAAAVFKQVGI